MAFGAVFSGCTNRSRDHEHEAHEHENHGHEAHALQDIIEISPERQDMLGIQTASVRCGDFQGVIHTSGQILSASGDEMTVVAPGDGIVLLADLAEGSPVGKGSRIATISSKALSTGDLLAKARITYEITKKEYERDLQLKDDNIVSESHLDKSRLDYEHAKAEYEALTAGGVSDAGISVSSPLQGFVKQLMVQSGDFVRTGTPIAAISRNRTVLLRADVPDKYYNRVPEISDAVFTVSYSDRSYRLKELGGKMVGYGRSSRQGSFIPVTFELDNASDLIPGSYAEIFLKTSDAIRGVHVPLSAVLEDQGVYYVFVKDPDDPDAFSRREVRLGLSDGIEVLVTAGLEEGEEIVVEGAVHVKLAGAVAVPAGHTHNH